MMFNATVRREAVDRLRKSLAEHEILRQRVARACVRLFDLRRRKGVPLIEAVEDYVNGLARSPKDFERTVSEYRVAVDRFADTVERIEGKAKESGALGGGAGLAGAAAGAGLAVLGPSAALAVATTFGTASTGTAISALSGAAAANAALAWLGGGAVAAGGGGMAAGNALLALAGPVGWTVGGLAVLSSGIWLHYRYAELARKATGEHVRVEAEIRSLQTADEEIRRLAATTMNHIDGTWSVLDWLRVNAPDDYGKFDDVQKERLGALINHIRSLGELLRKEVAP